MINQFASIGVPQLAGKMSPQLDHPPSLRPWLLTTEMKRSRAVLMKTLI